jgi:hypothetical protein
MDTDVRMPSQVHIISDINYCSLRSSIEHTIMPVKLNIMYSEMSFFCWRCKTQKGTYLRMLWSCEGWLNSGKEYVLLSQDCYRISLILVFCLLVNVDTGDYYQKKLCNLSFIAAKKYIAFNWKVGYPPTMDRRNVKLSITRFDILQDEWYTVQLSYGLDALYGILYDKRHLYCKHAHVRGDTYLGNP